MDILRDIRLDIPEDIGLEFLTKLMGGRLIPRMESMLKEKKEECIEALAPEAIYDSFEIDRIEEESVYFRSGNIFKGPNISKILTGSEKAVIFIFTLGQKIGELIDRERDPEIPWER